MSARDFDQLAQTRAVCQLTLAVSADCEHVEDQLLAERSLVSAFAATSAHEPVSVIAKPLATDHELLLLVLRRDREVSVRNGEAGRPSLFHRFTTG